MKFSFEASQDFFHSLEEVQTLLYLAEEHSTDETKAGILLKSALVLLAGKFEAFAEEIAEEYIFNINLLKLEASKIPLPLKVHHTLAAIKYADQFKHQDRLSEAEVLFLELAKLWHHQSVAPDLKIECKFSYGKHGEKELKKLFWNVGVEDIFEYVILEEEQESVLDEKPKKVRLDFRADFNSLVSIRNNILHQDSSPNLTLLKIQSYSKLLKMFAEVLDKRLSDAINTIRAFEESLV